MVATTSSFSRFSARALVSGALVVAALFGRPEVVRVQSQAGLVTGISPAAGRSGDRVSITGRGFGAFTARVIIGGVPAPILEVGATRITFRVPPGLPPGLTTVTVFNPGVPIGSVPFRILEGILLPGSPSARVVDSTVDLQPVGVDGTQIRDGVFLTRLDVSLYPSATVGELNAALTRIQGGIVSMTRGSSFLTIAIPPADTIAALEQVATLLSAQPGVAIAGVAHEARPLRVFDGTSLNDITNISHLLPSRFPAAWNLASAITDPSGTLCVPSSVPVLMADDFGPTPPDGFSTLVPAFPAPAAATRPLTPAEAQHGYDVTLVLGAQGIGANPIRSCLNLRPVQSAALTPLQALTILIGSMPATGRFLVNYSLGSGGDICKSSPCQPPRDVLRAPLSRAAEALYWKAQTRDRWARFLIVAAAGNERAEESTAIYSGMGDSRFTSAITIAGARSLVTNYTFVFDPLLWTPPPAFAAAGFEPLRSTESEAVAVAQVATDLGLIGVVPDNVIVVGSATSQSPDSVLTAHVTPEQLAEAFFSDAGAEVLAVGENIFGQAELLGSSYAAPQVTGLASFLWALSPDLRDTQPVSVTRRAILANTRNRVIDAYATVLSLDPAAVPTAATASIRRTLLDVDENGGFDERDVDTFLRRFFVENGSTITRQAAPGTIADFSRYDLNGDGFTTAGARRERFDLDRVGSTQYGATLYSVVSQDIEGQEIRFDETALTDLEILCYYAYSPLYQGNPDARKDLLDGRCGLSIQPASVTLAPGTQQQFTATADASVSWTATGGTVTQDGLYTAGSVAGTYKVRVTRVDDPNAFAEASVTIGGGGGLTLLTMSAATGVSSRFATCISGPSAPADPPQITSPFGLQNPEAAGAFPPFSPEPNTGPIGFVVSPITSVSANCRTAPGTPNVAEVVASVDAAADGMRWNAYLSTSGIIFGTIASSVIGIGIDQPGTLRIVLEPGWLKGLVNDLGRGRATLVVEGLSGGNVFCEYLPSPDAPFEITTTCPSSIQRSVSSGERILMQVGISGMFAFQGGPGEGRGRIATVTLTPVP